MMLKLVFFCISGSESSAADARQIPEYVRPDYYKKYPF